MSADRRICHDQNWGERSICFQNKIGEVLLYRNSCLTQTRGGQKMASKGPLWIRKGISLPSRGSKGSYISVDVNSGQLIFSS